MRSHGLVDRRSEKLKKTASDILNKILRHEIT